MSRFRAGPPPIHRVALTVSAGIIAGVLATLAKTQAEALFQPAAEKVWPPSPPEKRIPGADPADHPENMPPAEIATAVAEVISSERRPSKEQVVAAGDKIHWAMGVGSATAYALLSTRYPRVRAAAGAPAGLALYLLTHGSSLPLAGLQPAPWRMPRAAVAWEASSHVIYGATVEIALRIQDRFAR